jgi:hypothetical protein
MEGIRVIVLPKTVTNKDAHSDSNQAYSSKYSFQTNDVVRLIKHPRNTHPAQQQAASKSLGVF